MSYMHIDNLYKSQDILAYRQCYAMEKIHGTSAHVRFKRTIIWGSEHLETVTKEEILFFSGGVKHEDFIKLFDKDMLLHRMSEKFAESLEVTIFGEAYGGKCQGMSKTYGKDLRFVAFEVKIDEHWLDVPAAEAIARHFGFDFVHYKLIPTTMEAINAERDSDSVQAFKNGMGLGHMREGIVLRPLVEVKKNNGERIIAKHKRSEFCETASKREADPTKRQLLEDADSIAYEWVTHERLQHVVDSLVSDAKIKTNEEGYFVLDITATGEVIKAMIADIVREAGDEIMDTKEARKAIGARAAQLYKTFLQEMAWKPVVGEKIPTFSLEPGEYSAVPRELLFPKKGPACPNAIGDPGVQGPEGEPRG